MAEDCGKSSKFVVFVEIDGTGDEKPRGVGYGCKRKEPASLMTRTTGAPEKDEEDEEAEEE